MKDEQALMYGAAALAAYYLYMKNKAAPVAPATLDPTAGVVPNTPAGGSPPNVPILAGPVSTQNYYYPTSTGQPTGYGSTYQPSVFTNTPTNIDPATGQPVVTPPTNPVGGGGDNSAPITNGQGKIVPRGSSFPYQVNSAGQAYNVTLQAPNSGMVLYFGIRPPGDSSGQNIWDFLWVAIGGPAGAKRTNDTYQDACGYQWSLKADKPVASVFVDSGTRYVLPGEELLGSDLQRFSCYASSLSGMMVTPQYPTTFTLRCTSPSGQTASKTLVVSGPGDKPIFPR